MTARYVTLGNGRKISLGAYVRAWKTCRSLNPRTWIGPGVSGFGQTAGEALVELRRGLDDRINMRGIRDLETLRPKEVRNRRYSKMRKLSADWQRAMTQAASALNTPRLVIHWLPADLRKRFAHRLFDREAA